jgi:hypothetical protein
MEIKNAISAFWFAFKEPFRIINVLFDNDAHTIVSKRGWQTIEKNDTRPF